VTGRATRLRVDGAPAWLRVIEGGTTPRRDSVKRLHVFQGEQPAGPVSRWSSDLISMMNRSAASVIRVAHFMPDDDGRAREIMNAFFAEPTGVPGEVPSALIAPGGTP
jgi:hypothetical protein